MSALPDFNATAHTFRILVSKNNGPFMIVKSENRKDNLNIEYIIDF